MEKLNLSILIPAYNEEKNIAHLLQKVADSLLVTGLMSEVIVLPNGCTDSTAQYAVDFIRDRKDKNINWDVVLPDRSGKSHALNVGLETAKAEVVMDLDADCIPEEQCIFKVYDTLCRSSSLMLAGALDVPNFEGMDKSTLLYQYERTQQIWREERGRVIPVGGAMGYKRAALDKFPENLHSEDTWLALEVAKKFDWEAVRVLTDAVISTFPPGNWFDYLKQQSRWDAGYVQVMSRFPELQQVYDNRRKHFNQRPKEEIMSAVKSRMRGERIPLRRLRELSGIIDSIVVENGAMMDGQLIRADGSWDTLGSTKSLPNRK